MSHYSECYKVDTSDLDERVTLYETIKGELRGVPLAPWLVEGTRDSYVFVNDGEDVWFAEEQEFVRASQSILNSILEGSGPRWEEWYSAFCMECDHVVSRLGSGSLEDIEALEEDSATTLKLCEEWGYPPEDIPDQLDGERFIVLDAETGEATGNLMQFGGRWLYWDATDGFRLISDEDKQRLTVDAMIYECRIHRTQRPSIPYEWQILDEEGNVLYDGTAHSALQASKEIACVLRHRPEEDE